MGLRGVDITFESLRDDRELMMDQAEGSVITRMSPQDAPPGAGREHLWKWVQGCTRKLSLPPQKNPCRVQGDPRHHDQPVLQRAPVTCNQIISLHAF